MMVMCRNNAAAMACRNNALGQQAAPIIGAALSQEARMRCTVRNETAADFKELHKHIEITMERGISVFLGMNIEYDLSGGTLTINVSLPAMW